MQRPASRNRSADSKPKGKARDQPKGKARDQPKGKARDQPKGKARDQPKGRPKVEAKVKATAQTDADVEVRRSARRRRTVAAYREGGRIVVLIPARFSAAQEREWVGRMVARVDGTGRRRRGDAELARRARELSTRYLDARVAPTSVRWVPAMRTRWASCTPDDGSIRLSDRLQDMPGWVLDYVLVHELAHLLESGHGPRFWRLVGRYPRTERARGYLDGVTAAANLPIDAEGDVDEPSDVAH